MKKVSDNTTFYIYVKKWCPRRSLEASRFYNYLLKNNLKSVNNPKKADLIFVYTCGGFSFDESLSVLTVEYALKYPSAKVVVTGCLPKINPDRLKRYPNIIIINPNDFDRFDSLINAKVPYRTIPSVSTVKGVHDLYHGTIIARIRRNIQSPVIFFKRFTKFLRKLLSRTSNDSLFNEKTYRIEIAKGCLGNCSYCAIKLAMPAFHSFPEEQIINNFVKGLKLGHKIFALLAGDIGCYGVDINTDLPSLLKKLFAVKGNYRVVLVDMNAYWFVKYFSALLPILEENQNKISKIIMPIQSGSDRILQLMNRSYKIDEVKKCLSILHEAVPKIDVETHILVGFPGETEEDFQKSIELIREVKFSKVDFYKYEDRPGTKASKLPNKVSREITEQRIATLSALVDSKMSNKWS